MTDKDRKELREKIHIIADGAHSENYIVYRVEMLIEHAIKQGEERGYIMGWNAACEDGPEKMKPIKKSYGFRDV